MLADQAIQELSGELSGLYDAGAAVPLTPVGHAAGMQPEHHDPFSESARGGLERLMAIGVLTEAGSRMAAERARSRVAQQERQLERDRAVQDAEAKARRLARAGQSRRARQWRTLAGDPDRLATHLRGLPVQEVARHWAQAASHTGADRTGDAVLAATERELRGRMPTLMGVYDLARRDGVPPQQAMYAAAQRVFGGGGRPHGASPAWWAAGALPVVGDELERQLWRSAGRLDPMARGRWLRGLEQRGWSPESLAWAEAILAGADGQRRIAAAAAATVEDPATVVEERTGGLAQAAAAAGRAGDLARDAGAVAGTAGHPATADLPQPAAPPTGRPAVQPGGPVRLAGASFATPAAAAVLRPAVPPPAPGAGRPAAELERASRKGRSR
jgi:hypothetical protein